MEYVYSEKRGFAYKRRSNEERFWEKVDQRGECWLWTAQRDPKGYGRFHRRIDGQKRLRWIFAHRFSLTMTLGREIPRTMEVCHHCDNPSCVRPEHLFEGTRTDNVRDSMAKGRFRNGTMGRTHCKYGHALTPENTKIQHGGKRRCAICVRRYSRDQARERRASR